jgi:NRPS condensation-like uncharacterized protein
MKNEAWFRPEAFELLQYFFGTVHEPLVRAYVAFSGCLDEAALCRAVEASAKTVPLLFCVFDASGRRPRWRRRDFSGADVVKVVFADTADAEKAADALLTEELDFSAEPQVKLNILRAGNTDRLCVIASHLLCDASGLKQYLALLGTLYAAETGNAPVHSIKTNLRKTRALFAGFSLREKLSILASRYDAGAQKHTPVLALAGDPSNPRIITRTIPPEEFAAIKAFSRSNGASVNDALLSAYLRVLSRTCGERTITIPCPVDLRKYLSKTNGISICNMTTNLFCSVAVNPSDNYLDTLKQVTQQMNAQKTSPNCLKSVVSLETAFRVLPFPLLKKEFPHYFTMPKLSYTNLGILEKESLRFGEAQAVDAFMTGAIKHSPYFQIAVSTFENALTLSCNLYAADQSVQTIESFLYDLQTELISGCRAEK